MRAFKDYQRLGARSGVGDIDVRDNNKLNNNLSGNQEAHYNWYANYQERIKAMEIYKSGTKLTALFTSSLSKRQTKIIYNRNYQLHLDWN